MNPDRVCSQCRASLPDDAPEGLCPRCLLAGVQTTCEVADTLDESTAQDESILALLARRLPDYKLLRKLGEGGMGAVWLAENPVLGRQMAIKVLSPRLSSEPGFAERFEREARVMAQLDHPHIASIRDFGTAEGLCFIVMDYYPSTLRVEMQGLPATIAERLSWLDYVLGRFQQVCLAVQYLHDKGFIHRDLKPENILVGPGGAVLADFGLARPDHATDAAVSGAATTGAEPLTQAGTVLGTPLYMSPEQKYTPRGR